MAQKNQPKKNMAPKKAASTEQRSDKSSATLAFGKMNYILLAVGMAIILLGFILMSGNSSTPEAFDPEIFSTMHIKVAPMVCLFGFLFIIVAILYHKKDNTQEQ